MRDLVSRFPISERVCSTQHQVFLEITVCRWKSSRGFGNTVTWLGVSLTLDGAKDEGGHTETGAKNREWFYAAEVGGGTEPWLRKVPKGRVRLTEVVGQARHVTASGGDRAGGVGTRWAGPMVSPPLTTLATQGAGRLERSARGTDGMGGGAREKKGGGRGGEGVGDGHGVMLVTLASANFGTARENFSLDFPRKTRTALDTANRLEL